jgi:hypothetical protein
LDLLRLGSQTSINFESRRKTLMSKSTTFPASCYSSRSAFSKGARGAVFTFLSGERRLVLDNWLCFAQISEDATELKLAYSCCVVILYGRELQTVFEDAVKQELGEVREGGVPDNCPETGLWIDSLQIIDPPGSVEDQAFHDYVRKRGEHLVSEPELEGTSIT